MKLTPNKLFIMDGFGALLSAMLLGIVLVRFQSYVGIPVDTLYFLAAIPCGFALYDLICWLSNRSDKSRLLLVIAVCNILYCVLSLSLALSHLDMVTWLGWVYLIGEVLIVMSIAVIEIRVSRKTTLQG